MLPPDSWLTAAAHSCCHARVAVDRPRVPELTAAADQRVELAERRVTLVTQALIHGWTGGSVLEEIGDLIDVLAHGVRGGLGIALPQRGDDGFVSQDRLARTALLLQRELARFHEQIVQRGHDADDDAIARGAREHRVKRRVLDDGRVARS